MAGTTLPGEAVSSGSFVDGHNPLTDNVALFLMQLLIIIVLSKTLGFGLAYLRQPSVIAEVVGGILLGPTFLGRFPSFTETIFPPSSLPRLKLIADFGLVLYLFLIGIELDPVKVQKEFKKSAMISLAGIALPFFAGVGVSKVIYDTYISKDVSFVSFFVFCGVAMSITAFPILARILGERKLMGTVVGQCTLAAAASDDAIAWSLLVLVVALINNPSKSINAVYVFLIVLAYAAFLWVAVRPILRRLVERSSSESGASQTNVFVVFCVMVISSFFTQGVGVHAIFGAFLTGMIVPHERGFAIAITEKMEDLVSILFVPLYFAYSGLNTRLNELNDLKSWGFVALVFAVACGGKIIGCTAASRFSGMGWRESITVGFLMNTKGAGVITDKVFGIFLIMALLTTFMTTPIVSWLYPMHMYQNLDAKPESVYEQESQGTIEIAKTDTLSMLVVLPNMKTVPAMMNMCKLFFDTGKPVDVFALRLVELGTRMSQVMMASDHAQTMQSDPVINIFRTFGQLNKRAIKTLLTVSSQELFAADIAEAGRDLGSNLIIFPIEHSPTTYPKGWALTASDQLFHTAPCPTALFVDRGYGAVSSSIIDPEAFTAEPVNQRIVFPFYGSNDDIEACLILNYMALGSDVSITVLCMTDQYTPETTAALEAITSFPTVTMETIDANTTSIISKCSTLGKKDLVILGYAGYESLDAGLVTSFKFWLDTMAGCSYMVVKQPNVAIGMERGDSKRSLRGVAQKLRKRAGTGRPASIL